MPISGVILGACGLVLAALTAAAHRALSRAVGTPRPRAGLTAYPSLTIVRPIKGLDVEARRNLEALYAAEYPGKLQVLLVLDDAADPAYATACAAAEGARARGISTEVVLCGRPPPARTGKLHAMIEAMPRATGELVAFNDSDSRPGPGLFRRLVDELLQHPRAGCAFAPVAAVPAGAPTAGDVGYALLLNAWYGSVAALVAGASGELPFIMGQAMVFTREALAAAGGLACAEGHFVDDMRIGKCVHEAGFVNVQVDEVMPIAIGGMSVPGFVKTFRRWLFFGQGGLSLTFTWMNWARGIAWGLAVGMSVAAAMVAPMALPATLLALAAIVASDVGLQRRRGGASIPWRLLWVPLVLPLVGGAVLVATKVSRRVDWRGRQYDLRGPARLAAPTFGDGLAARP